jgi:hypothetical protein
MHPCCGQQWLVLQEWLAAGDVSIVSTCIQPAVCTLQVEQFLCVCSNGSRACAAHILLSDSLQSAIAACSLCITRQCEAHLRNLQLQSPADGCEHPLPSHMCCI